MSMSSIGGSSPGSAAHLYREKLKAD